MKRTSPDKEREVLTSILMGASYAAISHKSGVPVSTIKKIKKRSDMQMSQLHDHILKEQAVAIDDLLQLTNKQVSRLLTKAELGLVDISVHDLCRLMESLNAQATIKPPSIKSLKKLTTVTQKYQ